MKTAQRPDTGSGERPPAGSTAPERWLEDYGDELFGFALNRVRERAAAQDLVQETFLAALRSRAKFAGRSSERAWLFGILRNKVVDYYRLKSREAVLTDDEAAGADETEFFHSAGPRKDAWFKTLAPQPWATPDESLARKEFREVFQQCLAGLPEKLARVFFLREVEDVATEQICKDLGISPNNFWVMSHRARLALRRCLEVHWFGRKETRHDED